MKISSIRADGYGLLYNTMIDQIDPQLTVVYGQNEAGKSTLVDLVRGVLFGFPDRRRNQLFHPPLRGGRHGGALGLLDEVDQSWFVERHVGDRSATVTGPDGSIAPDGLLERMLGGADDALFRSVFAFGLTELSAIESLERDEVQELVFSAGVLGAGRSATRAARNLEGRQSALARPRQQGATANRLWQHLREIDVSLHAAREGASGFASAQIACDELQQKLDDSRQLIDGIRQRMGELERLEACWPTWRKREDSTAKLTALGPRTPELDYALEHGEDLRDLVVRFSGHKERLRRRNELRLQSSGIERELQGCLDDIGGIDIAEIGQLVDVPLEVRDEIHTLAKRSQELSTEIRALAPGVDHAVEIAVLLTAELESADALDRDTAVVTREVTVVRELRHLTQDRERRESEILSETREARLLGIERQHSERSRRRPLVSVAMFATIALGAGSAYAAYHREAVASITGLVLMILAVITTLWVVSHRNHDLTVLPNVLLEGQTDDLARLAAQIAERAELLGLPHRPNLAEVELIEARLGEEVDKAQARAEIERRATEAVDRASRAKEPVDERSAELDVVSNRVRDLCGELGLATTLSAEGLVTGLGHLVQAHELSRARTRVKQEIAELDRAINGYEEELGLVARALSFSEEPSGQSMDEKIDVVNQLLDSAMTTDHERTVLLSAVESANDVLGDTLGSDEAADRLLKELASGATTSWSDERSRLNATLEEIMTENDKLIGSLRDAERHLEDLLKSDVIARLELERNGVQSALDDALFEYMTIGVARALLSSTLTRYEQERQPAVIAHAADLFKKITDERYTRIVARADEDDHHQSIEAITRTGERVSTNELSRGSAEQLYLCLRLALAEAFAQRAVALPFVFDDILVNFDPERALAVAEVIAQVSARHQVIAFTCHPHVVELFSAARPGAAIIELTSTDIGATPDGAESAS